MRGYGIATAAFLAVAAGLTWPVVGQQAEGETDGIVPQPRFIRAPEPGEILVTPLTPPGGEVGPVEEAIEQERWNDAPGASLPRMPSASEPGLQSPGGVAVPINSPPTDLRAGVRLRELDKMTGQTETFELAVGESRQVGRLKVQLDACRSPEGNDVHGTIAFLKVWDVREPEDEAFSGWMFAESPSLSALDHPRYDLWVISCTTSSVAVSGPSE